MFNTSSIIPQWFFFNDSLIILFNAVGIFIALLFIITVIRVERRCYSISNLIGCHTCLAVALTNLAILINGSFALINYYRNFSYVDRFCYIRGIFFIISSIYMHIAFCIKAFNRFRCIVYNINQQRRVYRQFFIFMLIQWSIVIILIFPILFTDSIEYHWPSKICLISTNKRWQFVYLMFIYCITILFISIVYLYILYYVVHLPLLERYRRKRQFALLRRIPILLLMIIAPGFVYSIIVIRWHFFDFVPFSIFKISSLVESIGHTGAVLTVFISNSRLRREYYRPRRSKKPKENAKKLHQTTNHRKTKLLVHHASAIVNEKLL